LTARILAVANAFVALVSARAYRRGLSVEQALDRLMAEADRTFDRRVVAALYHTAENRRDWSIWQETDV
jgi:HD-GYP domain-containing protein (c-di-GMP phosphodiesterase class II)